MPSCTCGGRGAPPLCSPGCTAKPHLATCAFTVWMDTPTHTDSCAVRAPRNITSDEAIGHAIRLLAEAELERTNMALMERLEKLADSWISIATLLREKERV